MNDFTKDELIKIYNFIERNKQDSYDDMQFKIIEDKLQRMIDNYCEHEWENICCQCTLDKIYCHKCEKDMGDLKERYDE